MKVSELIAYLQVAPPNADVIVRATDDGGSDYCGTVSTAQIEIGEDGVTFFAIDCDQDSSEDGYEDDDGAGEGDEAGEGEEGDEADEEEEDGGEEEEGS